MTPKITDLTDEEINLRIAEALGWQFIHHNEGSQLWSHVIEIKDPSGATAGSLPGDPPKFKKGKNADQYREQISQGLARAKIPAYCSDLNAIQSAFKSLDTETKFSVEKCLQRVIMASDDRDPWLVWATAKQRACAFLIAVGRAVL